MKNVKNRTLAIFFSSVLLLSILTILLLQQQKSEKNIACVYRDNVLLYEIDLESVKDNYEIDLKTNKILVENGKISMIYADCKDQFCVKHGYLSIGFLPIICLPNKILITVSDGGGYDAVSGR